MKNPTVYENLNLLCKRKDLGIFSFSREKKEERFFQRFFFSLIYSKKNSSKIQRSSVSHPGIDVFIVKFMKLLFLQNFDPRKNVVYSRI